MRQARTGRKTWKDYLATLTITGSVAGTITRMDLVDEATVEDDFEGDCTVLRVIGDIWVFADAGAPSVFFQLWGGLLPSPYLTTGNVVLDDLEDQRTMWTKLWKDDNTSTTPSYAHVPVDVRSKRRLRQNSGLFLFAFDYSAAVGANWNASVHLRTLIGHS